MSENKTTELVKAVENTPVMPFSNSENFEMAQRMASALARSSLVPQAYQGQAGLPNCLIALEMAQRVGISPFFVMQNMHIIHGRPSWSATYLIGAINTSGKFSPLRFRLEKLGKTQFNKAEMDNICCTAYATELATGERLEGPAVTMEMAVKEGWYGKNGSKWQTMPELMLRYRAAAFFSRLYCPEVAMGLHTAEEVYDVVYDSAPAQADTKERAKNLTEALLAEPAEDEIETEFLPPEPEQAQASPSEPESVVVETPAPAPKEKARPAKQPEPVLPPDDDAFDFPEADGEEGSLF